MCAMDYYLGLIRDAETDDIDDSLDSHDHSRPLFK